MRPRPRNHSRGECGTQGSNANGHHEVEYAEHVPADECRAGSKGRPTQEAKDHPRGRETDRHVAETRGQGEHGGQHIVRIQGQETQSRPAPRLNTGDKPQIERENEVAEGSRQPQGCKEEQQGRADTYRNGEGGLTWRTDESAAGTQ